MATSNSVNDDDIEAERERKIDIAVERIEALFEVLDILADGGDAMAVRKYLNRAEILEQDDLVFEDLVVPEWGGALVRVRTLNASERDHFEIGVTQRNGKHVTQNLENVRARLCILCLVDENGSRLFSDEDTLPLGGKSAAALDRIFDVARRLNKLRDEDIEELAGNSSAAQNGASL